MKTYYDILGIKRNATIEEIKSAYRKLSTKFHPDKNNGDEFFKEMFQSIQGAYEILSNPSKKQIYDSSIANPTNTYSENEVFDDLIIKIAFQIILENNASTAFIQRKFSIGYNRANKISEQLELLGIISSYPNYKVLVSQDGLKHIFLTKFPDRTTEINELSNKNTEIITKTDIPYTYNKPSNKSSVVSIWSSVIIWRRIKWTLIVIDIILALIILGNRNISLNTGEEINIKAISGINLRIEPNSNAAIIILIPYNESVKIISDDGPFETISGKYAKWIKVEYRRKTGWIWSGFTDYNK